MSVLENNKLIIVIISQLVSQLGTALTGFAIGICILELDNKITDLSMLYFYQLLPAIILMLPSGSIVDRVNKKLLLIIADLSSILLLIFVLFELNSNKINKTDLYFFISLSSLISVIQGLTMSSVIASSIKSTLRASINTLLDLQRSIPRLAGPFVGGILMAKSNINILVLINIMTFIASLVSISLISMPHKPFTFTKISQKYLLLSFIDDIRTDIQHILKDYNIIWIIIVLILSMISISTIGVYILPILLAQTSYELSGQIIAFGGLGAIIGSSIFSIILQKLEKVNLKIYFVIFITLLIQGLAIVLLSLSDNLLYIPICLFLYFFVSPALKGCSYSLLQEIIPKENYGRFFAFNNFILQIICALVFFLSGPIIDYFLAPLISIQQPTAFLKVVDQSSEIIAMLVVLGTVGIVKSLVGIMLLVKYVQK
jgi:MFS family permease